MLKRTFGRLLFEIVDGYQYASDWRNRRNKKDKKESRGSKKTIGELQKTRKASFFTRRIVFIRANLSRTRIDAALDLSNKLFALGVSAYRLHRHQTKCIFVGSFRFAGLGYDSITISGCESNLFESFQRNERNLIPKAVFFSIQGSTDPTSACIRSDF